jgi:hypothetical protein
VAKGCGSGLFFVGPAGVVLRAKNPSTFFGLGGAPPPSVGFRKSQDPAEPGWGTPLDGPGPSVDGIEWETAR